MKRYTINCHYDMVITVDVVADNEERAIELAREQADRMSLNSCAECVGHSECVADTEDVTAEELRRMENEAVQEYAAEYVEQQTPTEVKDIPAADLCWDEFNGKTIEVWGNIDKHAENLQRMRGVKSETTFKHNGTGRKVVTESYVFDIDDAEKVREYLHKVTDRMAGDFAKAYEASKRKGDTFKTGERVQTIYGVGTVTSEGNGIGHNQVIGVHLDVPTYNYIWSMLGTPQSDVLVNCQQIAPVIDPAEHYARKITEAAAMGCARCCEHQGKRVEVKAAYQNGHDDPTGWTYCVSWYDGKELRDCENGVTLEQAARALVQFEEENRDQADTLTEAEKRDTLYRLWDAAWQQARKDPDGTRVIVETNEADPSAAYNEFGRYYMIDGSENESCIDHAGQWAVIRSDIVESPYEVRRPNYAAAHGYADDSTQIGCQVANRNNVTRWARLMIDAGRVVSIYADCY